MVKVEEPSSVSKTKTKFLSTILVEDDNYEKSYDSEEENEIYNFNMERKSRKELCYEIQSFLINYVSGNCNYMIPLCEYLTIVDINNLLKDLKI